MSSSVWQINREWWVKVGQKVKRALVYLDTRMAELLHWSGGMPILLKSGAVDVREFSSFENGTPGQPKAVFLVSSTLTGVTESVLRDIVMASNFQYVVLMTTVSPLLHPGGHDDDWEQHWEEELLNWMGNMNYTAEVRHMPMFGVELCPQLFLAPAFSSMFPLLHSDLRQIVLQLGSGGHSAQDSRPLTSLSELELSHLPSALQNRIQVLSSGLHAFLQGLDVREDIYSVGHTSRLVATQLELYPPARSRRKVTQNRASLVLIDSSLDLSSALSHQTDTLLDKLTNSLQPLFGGCSDIWIDMSALTHVSSGPTGVILPGSLAPTSLDQRPAQLTPLVVKKQKEAVMEVNRRLVEAAAGEKLPLNLAGSRPGRVSADLLDSTLALFKGKYDLIQRHLDILQVAMATSQSLRKSLGKPGLNESVVVMEKKLVQALVEGEDGGSSPLSMLADLVTKEMEAQQRELTLDDLLCLLTLTYSLSGGECGDVEEIDTLKDKIVQWVMKDNPDLPPVMKQIVGDHSAINEVILHDQLDSVWERLDAVASTRDDLTQLSTILDPGDAMTPASVRPFLPQVVEAILDPAKPDLPDIECKSGGLGNLLKSGFGFFKGSGKPRPGDAPLLILFVVGGVTSAEVKQVKDLVDKAAPPFNVLIGSTRLASVGSTLEAVFVQDNVNIEVL